MAIRVPAKTATETAAKRVGVGVRGRLKAPAKIVDVKTVANAASGRKASSALAPTGENAVAKRSSKRGAKPGVSEVENASYILMPVKGHRTISHRDLKRAVNKVFKERFHVDG